MADARAGVFRVAASHRTGMRRSRAAACRARVAQPASPRGRSLYPPAGLATAVGRIQGPPGAGRVVATAFALAFLALVMARLLVQGGWAWVLFAVLLPVILLALVAILGWVLALLGTAFFASCVLAFRAVVTSELGWVAVAMVPVAAFSAMLGVRVVRRLRAPRGDGAAPVDEPVAPEPRQG